MTSRFTPVSTDKASAALGQLMKLPGVRIFGGVIDLNGGRSENDYLALRFGADVAISATFLAQIVKELTDSLGAEAPTLKLTLYGIAFPSGRDLMAFCDAAGDDFDRVTWQQD